MENQHRVIKGYRELSQAEIDLMNEIKAKGEELRELIGKVDEHVRRQYDAAKGNEEETVRLIYAEPKVWTNLAQHELQSGIMKLVRAVAQPGGF